MPATRPRLSQEQVRTLYATQKVRMVRKLLWLGYEMGFDVAHTEAEKHMTRAQVNKLHVNRWLLSEKSQVRKEMDDMTHGELVKALTQFELVWLDTKQRLKQPTHAKEETQTP